MRLVFWTALWIFLLDQISKYLIVHVLDLAAKGEIDVMPPFVNFRMAWNYGINFGLFSGRGDTAKWVLIGLAVAIVAFVLVWLSRHQVGRWGRISGGLLVGGALGNVVDRLQYGAVADFLNMTCCGIENPYAFNIADIAIFAGAIGLALFTGEPRKRGKKAP